MEFRIAFYATAQGEVPLAAFLDDLKQRQPSVYRSVSAGLDKLRSSERHGPPLTQLVDPDVGILELRVGHRDIARVFFFFRPGGLIVCTNGYVKKSQKLDPAELAKARRYKADWEARRTALKE
jgi:phage-related protein